MPNAVRPCETALGNSRFEPLVRFSGENVIYNLDTFLKQGKYKTDRVFTSRGQPRIAYCATVYFRVFRAHDSRFSSVLYRNSDILLWQQVHRCSLYTAWQSWKNFSLGVFTLIRCSIFHKTRQAFISVIYDHYAYSLQVHFHLHRLLRSDEYRSELHFKYHQFWHVSCSGGWYFTNNTQWLILTMH